MKVQRSLVAMVVLVGCLLAACRRQQAEVEEQPEAKAELRPAVKDEESARREPQTKREQPAKEIDKATVQAWEKRGFISGWMGEYQTNFFDLGFDRSLVW